MDSRSQRWPVGLMTLGGFFCFQNEASACEPILPLFRALTGANFIAASFWGLAAAVLIKCTAFACYEKSLSKPKAFLFMLAGNVVTTMIGVLVAAFAAAPSLFAVPLLVAVTLYAARQLLPRVNWPWMQYLTPGSLAGILTLMLFISYFFFGIAMSRPDPPPASYWVWKTGGLIIAIMISMVITTFYEEWIVHLLARKPKEPPSFYHAVVRANLLTLFIIMGCTAAYVLPQRFASPFFTITGR